MANDLKEQLGALEAEGTFAVEQVSSADELERLRLELLGRKGRLTGVLRGLGTLPPEERPVVGAEANRIKEILSAELEARKAAIAAFASRTRFSKRA